MASKLNIYPIAGTTSRAKSVSFDLTGLTNKNGLRISIENATHGIPLPINGQRFAEIEPDKTFLNGKIDLLIPEYSAQEVVSLFATIEEKIENKYVPISMYSATYSVIRALKDDFKGDINIHPAFAGPEDRVSINIAHVPNSRVVVAINDRRFNILTKPDGEGSISFFSKDVLTNEKSVMQKFEVFAYLPETNFTKAYSSGQYLHIVSQPIAVRQNVGSGSFSSPEDEEDISASCLPDDDPNPIDPAPPIGPPLPEILVIPPVLEEIINPDIFSDPTIASSPRSQSVVLPNGLMMHAGIMQVKDTDAETAGSANCLDSRVHLTTTKSSLRYLSDKLRYGILAPSDSEIILYVDEEAWNSVSVDDIIGIYHEATSYGYFTLTEKTEPSEYAPFWILTFDSTISIDEFVLCVPYLIITNTVANPTSIFPSVLKLSEITNDEGNEAIPVRLTLAASREKIYSGDISYVYIIVEAISGSRSHLYYYAVDTSGTSPNQDGWRQLTTTDDDNKNPHAIVDSAGTLHVIWESNRSGSSQLYYSALGPGYFSQNVSALASVTDKQSEVVQKEESALPFDYTSEPIMDINSPDDLNLVRFGDPYTANTMWVSNVAGQGVVQISDNTEIRVLGNAGSSDQSMAWTLIDRDDYNQLFAEGFEQRQYGISFNLKDNNDASYLNDATIDDMFEDWKSSYVESQTDLYNNIHVYIRDLNKYMLHKSEKQYDRIIPILGSYRNERLEEVIAAEESEMDDDFSAVLTSVRSTVHHFMIGLMPEKVKFTATNIQTFTEFCTENDLGDTECADAYLVDEETLVQTGRYKLVVIMSPDNTYHGSSDIPGFGIVRQISEPFSLNSDGTNFNISMYYRKMLSEDVAAKWNRDPDDTEREDAKYLASLYIAVNDEMKFAESFFVDFCNTLTNFHIGIGLPGSGQFRSNTFEPYETSVFDFVDVDLTFDNIIVGHPNVNVNTDLVTMPSDLRSSSMNVDDYSQPACFPRGFSSDYSWLTLGLDVLDFSQSPITIEGINQSPSISKGWFCDDIHLAWESNRNRFWDIYYSSSGLPSITLPFRHDTRITATESNSVRPALAVNLDSTRAIVWHDNRIKRYQIYAAKGETSDRLCGLRDCQADFADRLTNNDCSILFEFCADDDYSGAHFSIEFYSDSELNDFVIEISSSDYPQYFFVDGRMMNLNGYALSYGECVDVELKIPSDASLDFSELFNVPLYARLSAPSVSSSEVWFCQREEKNSIISFPAINLDFGCVHYRVSFYADSDRLALIHSAFSLDDQKRWYLNDNPPTPLTASGNVVGTDISKSVYYAPEVLPAEKIEHQSEHDLTTNLTERSLICGAKYYVTTEIYYASTGAFGVVSEFEYVIPCQDTYLRDWRKNTDAQNWICSGQGKQDRRVSKTENQAMFPSIAVDMTGQFGMAWQDHRNNDSDKRFLDFNPQIWYGFWDIDSDAIWSSGPGRYDTRMFPRGFKPLVLSDLAGTFFWSTSYDNKIAIYNGPFNVVSASSESCLITDNSVFNIDDTSSPNQYLKARVYEEDAKGSFVIGEDDTVSVIENCFFRLDVVGVPGVYAVRLKNDNDTSWSDWINVDHKRPDEMLSEDATPNLDDDTYMSAYSIDEERFIVPWFASPGNGIKTVCLQVMTSFGVSNVFCVNLIANITELEYVISMYTDSEMTTEVSSYEGRPVVSINAGNTTYIKVEFIDKQALEFYLDEVRNIDRYSDIAGITGSDNTLTFNVIQQGVNDQLGLILTETASAGIFTGQFSVEKSDGVYNKDGLAAVIVNVPNPCTKMESQSCGYDTRDVYNLMNLSLLRDFYVKYNDIFKNTTPETLLQKYKETGLAKIQNLVPLYEFYSVDDPRFMFGNPKFFISRG